MVKLIDYHAIQIQEEKEDFTANDFDRMYIGNADDLDKLLFYTKKYLDPGLIKKYFFSSSLKKISEFLKRKKDTS